MTKFLKVVDDMANGKFDINPLDALQNRLVAEEEDTQHYEDICEDIDKERRYENIRHALYVRNRRPKSVSEIKELAQYAANSGVKYIDPNDVK